MVKTGDRVATTDPDEQDSPYGTVAEISFSGFAKVKWDVPCDDKTPFTWVPAVRLKRVAK